MKKIFTLVAVALAAVSVNAQEKISVADAEIEAKITASYETPIENANENFVLVEEAERVFPSKTWESNSYITEVTGGSPIVMKDYIWEASTANMALKAVSTPNMDANPNESWQVKANGGNVSLSIEGGVEGFDKAYAPKNGNPSLAYKDFFEYGFDEESQTPTTDVIHRVGEAIWEPGCGKLPVKGCYYEFSPKAAGSLCVGIWLNKNLNNKTLYVIDETATLLPYGDIKLRGFRQNNTYEKDGAGNTVGGIHDFALNENYLIALENDTNRPFFGLATFNVTAGKKYYVFSSNSQLGIYGYVFTPGGSDGINEITNSVENANAPVYNLAGQRVGKDAKGILIQNGKKFIRK